MSRKRYGEGLTPRAILDRRCLDVFWVATWRDRARGALNDARSAIVGAECDFATARFYAASNEPRAVEAIESGFRSLDRARSSRRDAKRFALMAVRGRDLECWVGRDKNSERRSPLIVHGCRWESSAPGAV